MILARLGRVKSAIDDITKTLYECETQFREPNDKTVLETKDTHCLVYELVLVHPTGEHYLSTAVEITEKLYMIYEKHPDFGEIHSKTLSAMLRRAMILEKCKRCNEAMALYEKAYEKLSQNDALVANVYSVLILYHRADLLEHLQGKTHEAKDAFMVVNKACIKFLGKNPPNEKSNNYVRAIGSRIPDWCSWLYIPFLLCQELIYL